MRDSATGQASSDFYYFFMKVGFGNCFLESAGKLGGLWVGFSDSEIPEVDANGLCRDRGEKADLRHLAVASSDKWRGRIRIVTYGKDAVFIWKPTGSLKPLDRNSGGIDWAIPKTYKSFPSSWRKEIKQSYGGVGSDKFFNFNFGPKGWKLLPAELVATIRRESLVAPIDSLSVWQNFSRNTFKPMFALPGNPKLQELSWLNDIPGQDPLPITEKECLEEQPFGKLVRHYFNNKVDAIGTFVPVTERLMTALSIFNPAQVETAAMLISRDLGLTVDVGLGKGLDVADVKATSRHLSSREQVAVIGAAVKTLENCGVKFTDKLRHSVLSSKTIRIQCKAKPGKPVAGTVMVVEPFTVQKNTKKDRLCLEQLANSTLPMTEFRNWLKLLEYDLS